MRRCCQEVVTNWKKMQFYTHVRDSRRPETTLLNISGEFVL